MMMLFLFALFLIFSIVIFLLCQQFGREQKLFEQKMEMLQQVIVESNRKSTLQSNKMQLTEDLEKTLQANRVKISDAIFNLNYDLFELLSQHNLLKPRK